MLSPAKKPKLKICPSLLSADFTNLYVECHRVLNFGADWLHIDVMDGHFVPNISFGATVIKNIKKKFPKAYLDCHLMVSDPDRWFPDFVKQANIDSYTFHIESVSKKVSETLSSFCVTGDVVGNTLVDVSHPDSIQSAIDLIKKIKSTGCNAGLALKPNTPIGPYLDKIINASQLDLVLIMTVEPGFGGQSFMDNQMEKVVAIRKKYPQLDIQVDGGLNLKTINVAYSSGANVIVAGSAIFKSKSHSIIHKLRDAAHGTTTPFTPKMKPFDTFDLSKDFDIQSLLIGGYPFNYATPKNTPVQYNVGLTRLYNKKVVEKLASKALSNKFGIYYPKTTLVLPQSVLQQLLPLVSGFLSCGEPVNESTVKNVNFDNPFALKVISNHSVGTDHIDIKYLATKGVVVGHTPGVLSESCGDFAVALILSTIRRQFESNRKIVLDQYFRFSPYFLCAPFSLGSSTTVGIVGLGSIGAAIARKLYDGWKVKIIYHNRTVNSVAESKFGAKLVSLTELCTQSDIIVVSCPLTSETTGLFGKAEFQMMKPTTFFINISRGKVVKQQELYDALVSDEIAGAALDVTDPEPLPFDHPIMNLENCFITSHVASADIPTRTHMGELAIDNLVSGMYGKPMPAEKKIVV